MNEHDVIVFFGNRIFCLPDNVSDTESDIDEYDDEYLLEVEDDIYMDEHPWDTRSYTGYRFRPDIVYFGSDLFSDY
jgi:hypothetical protein